MSIKLLRRTLEQLEKWEAGYKAMADSGDAGYWSAEEQEIYQQSQALSQEIRDRLNKGKSNA